MEGMRRLQRGTVVAYKGTTLGRGACLDENVGIGSN
jgi:hypothetical protein